MKNMKKTRFIGIFAICIAMLLSLIACGGDGYELEHFYGVVRWSEECEDLVIYVPEVGEVRIPEHEFCYAFFDGSEENENTAYALKEGDFVCINFKYEKAWDDRGVKIMETAPAQFDRAARSIEALAENITFEKTDAGYVLSMVYDRADDVTVGNSLYFVHHGGKNGKAFQKLIAEGVISEIAGERVTVLIKSLDSEKEFFEKFTSVSLETELSWMNTEIDRTKPYFTGEVTKKSEGGCLLAVTDVGNGNYGLGNEVFVHIPSEGFPAYEVGDFLTVSFDGKMALSLPPQVTNVYAIYHTDSTGNIIK